MTSADALRILEMTPPFTESHLKSSYREQLMVWHPDRFAGNDLLRRKAEQRTYTINEAYNLLSRLGPSFFSKSQDAPKKTATQSQTSTSETQRSRGVPPKQNPNPQPRNYASAPLKDKPRRVGLKPWLWGLIGVVGLITIYYCLNRETVSSPEEALALGIDYAFGIKKPKNPARAQKWLEYAADRGSAAALDQLARLRTSVLGQKDDVAALEVYRKYADRGYAYARVELGWCYMRGEGVEKNPVEGLRWWKLAALQGNAEAQELVGTWLFDGADGIPQDRVASLDWYEKAAQQGRVDAQYHLGEVYCYGEGGPPRSYSKAKMWLERALKKGHKSASALLAENERQRSYDLAKRNPQPLGKPDDSLTHRPSDIRLNSGAVLTDTISSFGGKGKLVLDNGLAEDAYVKVVQAERLVVSFYVRGGSRYTFTNLPDGSYEVLYCTGFGWDPEKRDFSRGRHALKYVNPLIFSTRTQPERGGVATYTDIITLTLHKVAFGNAKTSDISLAEFDRY